LRERIIFMPRKIQVGGAGVLDGVEGYGGGGEDGGGRRGLAAKTWKSPPKNVPMEIENLLGGGLRAEGCGLRKRRRCRGPE